MCVCVCIYQCIEIFAIDISIILSSSLNSEVNFLHRHNIYQYIIIKGAVLAMRGDIQINKLAL